jgi:selenocysteine-specific elongation factor
VAINLQGVKKEELKRGYTVVIPERFISTKTIDAKIELLSDAPVLKSKGLVHFYLGTSDVLARVVLYERDELKADESCYCQFRLQDPVISMSGDRYIIRRFSPVETIGGGEVLDPSSYRRKRKEGTDDLKIFESGTLSEKIATKIKKAGMRGMPISFIEGWIKTEISSIKDSISTLKKNNVLLQFEDILLHNSSFNAFKEAVKKIMAEFHKKNPLKPGMLKEELRVTLNIEQKLFQGMITSLKDIAIDKEIVRLATHSMILSASDETLKIKILELLENSGFQPPTKEELSQSLELDQKHLSDILRLMAKEGSLMRINDSMYITTSTYNKIIESLKDFFRGKTEMTVAEFRDILGTTRKYALPFLEYLDSHKITLRVGDVRKLLLK